MKHHRQTLIELLLVCSMILVVLSVVTREAYMAMLLSRQYSQEAVTTRRIELVRRAWQAWLADTNPADWQLADGTLSASPATILLDGDALHFSTPTRDRRVFLPDGSTIAWDLHPDQRYAVLTVTWPVTLGSRRDHHSIRLVAACPLPEAVP